jgi:putative membrane-bound dehydrogenase-like protein
MNNPTILDVFYPHMRTFSFHKWIAAASLAATTVLAADAQPDQKTSEADLLKDVKVPAGFDATIFAAPPMANYPVFVAASTDGTLYVSSDGNGSLGRDPHRGRILRLRDTDGDGHADEVKEFVKDVDSPRGLIWDHDRLYLLHPPNISAFNDKDGDGIADEERVLVKGIGWTFKDRPADHASNGLELGIDGWIYCAIGDFGFMEAEGTDGRKVQLRGGGVVRVRPDGTGLHIYARGTRNILEAAVSPLLDVITRDNTNDGGGWDIRLHHNTGLANHGYPSLFKNFPDEIIQPLADYGGGSGCGAAWIDEPGIPVEWNNCPFTSDWGRGWVYAHHLTPKGATFEADQKQFIGMTRPTDLDVDGNSRIYIASWKGATFNWAGPNVGYIVQLRPKGFTPAPMPNFEKASTKELVEILKDKSARRRLEAQRTILKRTDLQNSAGELRQVANGSELPLVSRAAALLTLAQEKNFSAFVQISKDPRIRPFVIQALGDPSRKSNDDEQKIIVSALRDPDPRVRREACIAVAFQNIESAARDLSLCMSDADPVVSHTAVEAMKRIEAIGACYLIYDATSQDPKFALRVLSSIHKPEVIDWLRDRLQKATDSHRRVGLFTALCRLYNTDGKWKGDSWGTRPDTSGPYYQAETWSESPRILRALNDALEHATPGEVAALAAQLNRHKIQSDRALDKLIDGAATDPKALQALLGQLVGLREIPAAAEPLLLKAAAADSTPPVSRGQAILALARVHSPESVKASLAGLTKLEKANDAESEGLRRQARNQFLNSTALESQLELLEAEAARGNILADAAILSLAERRNGSPEAKESAKAAFTKAWSSDSVRKVQLLKAMAVLDRPTYRDDVLSAMEDPDSKVAAAARETARALRLERRRNNAPKIESMSIPDVIVAVMKTKGDVELGKRLFTQQTCVNCHTVSDKEPQRGPYLGNIAATYKRPELAENILNPNKTIAQGFVANHFELKNGDELDAFVTLEGADKVTVRDTTSKESVIPVNQIVKRTKLEKSLMPEGLAANLTINEFASLLDYLESLNTK